MSNPVFLLLLGGAYVVLFGGLSLVRREGLSLRFALEAVLMTGLFSALAAITGWQIHPVLFLLLLYVITMRVRILVDLGSALARNRRFAAAQASYALAARLSPDPTGKLIIRINRGTALLQQNLLDEAVEVFQDVLSQPNREFLGVKYEAAAHYNLAVAYLRKNQDARATAEFNAVLDTWPASEFARHAALALEKNRRKNSAVPDKDGD